MLNYKSCFQGVTIGKSSTAIICGIAVIVLSILGLLHLIPKIFLAISIIVLGVAYFIKGGAIYAEYSKLLSEASGTTPENVELGGGISFEIITGIAAIVLGILALIGVFTVILSAVAVIVLGCGLIIGSELHSKLSCLKLNACTQTTGTTEAVHSHYHKITKEILANSITAQVLAAVAVVILGILSLVGLPAAVTLALVATLILGITSLVRGSTIIGKILACYNK